MATHNSPNNYLNAIAARAHAVAARAAGILKVADDGPVHLGATDTFQHFRSISATELMSGNYTRPVTVTDIETGHNDQVISVAALKGVVDKRTGEFRVVDVYERYYEPDKTYSASFNMSREVHGLTADKITKLRAAQGATYNNKYDQSEARDLMSFMKGSLVVGHNVEEFDFSRLGIASALQDEDILDTLVWAENAGIRPGQRGLAKVFKRLTGRTLKQAGYSHHFGFHDVLSNAEVFAAMYRQKGKIGRDVRFVTNKRGYSYGAYEDAMGTAVIKGGYYKGRGAGGLEYYMHEDDEESNEDSVFEYDYDDNGNRVLPDGYSWSDEMVAGGDETGDYGTLMSAQLAQQYQAMTEALRETKEATIGFKIHQQNQLIRSLAGKDRDVAEKYLRGLSYGEKEIEIMMAQMEPLRIDRERKESKKKFETAAKQRESADFFINHLYRSGEITKADWTWLSDINNDASGFAPQEVIDFARERKTERTARIKEVQARKGEQEAADLGNLNAFAQELSENNIYGVFDRKDALKRAARHAEMEEAAEYGNWRSYARDLTEEETEGFDRNAALKKIRYLDRAERHHDITKEQKAELDNLIGSFDDLRDATEDMIEANQRLEKTYRAIASIKPYDINRLIGTAHEQWGGVKGAARGVVPDFIRTPLSRLGDAALNAVDRSVSPWNAVQRVWNSGVGSAVTGGLTAGLGLPGLGIGAAISGGINTITQIGGNTAQSKLEMFGLSLQNNLNTLGAMVSWIATPFQLLHKATKLLTGSFGGLSYKINNIMGNGISMMSQMGNPLTELTGVDYASYAGSNALDFASLLNKGSTNSVYEDFAYQKAGMMYGDIDFRRMRSAAMLGVFDKVYMGTGNTREDFTSTANSLLNTLRTDPSKRADVMYLAKSISSSLPAMLHSANMLGVEDISTLMNPKNRGMYWTPMSSNEERKFRWTQYEYSAASEQFGFSKMRIANKLWDAFGRDLYNGVNIVVDKLASGDWRGALKGAAEIWDTFKEKFKKGWNAVKDYITGEEGEDTGWGKSFKILGLQLTNIMLGVAKTVVNIWDTIIKQLASKAQGLIAYLSTVQIKPHIDKKTGEISFEVDTINNAKKYADLRDKPIYDRTKVNQTTGDVFNLPVKKDMAGYDALANVVYAGNNYKRAYATPEELYWDTARYLAEGNTIDLSKYGYDIPGGMVSHASDLTALFDSLAQASSKGAGWRDVAAWYQSDVPDKWKVQGYADKTGISAGVNKAIGTLDSLYTQTIDSAIEKNNKYILELKVTDGTGKTLTKKMLSDGQSIISQDLIHLRDLVADGVNLVVQQVGGN